MRSSAQPRNIPASTWLLTIVAFSIVGLLYANLRNRQRTMKAQIASAEKQIRDQQARAFAFKDARSKLIERDELKIRVAELKLPLRETTSSEVRRIQYIEPPGAMPEAETMSHE